MKRTPLILALIGLLRIATAGTTNVYFEDWGTTNGGNSLAAVGWTSVTVTPNSCGPFIGIFAAAGASDAATGNPLPANTAFFVNLLPNQTAPAMIYTTDSSGNGGGGDSSFTDIDPTLYTNLTLTAEVGHGAASDTNYFAVEVGGLWYVCTSYQMPIYNNFPVFTNAMLIYTNPANIWQSLTIGSTSATIGAVASPNLSSPITGLGIVQLPTANGFNYNEVAVTALAAGAAPPPPPSIVGAISPQNVFVGGGASFAISAAGAKPLTYIWESNGVPLPAGDRYFGISTNTLTITNINANDASVIYSVIVTNVNGASTNSGLTLNVSSLPDGLLYAELFPYVGPTGSGNLPLSTVGWASGDPGSGGFNIFQDQGTGAPGDVFSFSATAATNIYYTTDTNDVGTSGLPFLDINPNNYPAVTFQAGFVPGNNSGQTNGAVSVYWAVSMNGVWYCTAQPIPIALTVQGHPYTTNQFQFNPAATNWNNLTVTATSAIIGSQASGPLTGNITGAGLVVAHNDSTGSDMNFQNFEITTNAPGTLPNIGSTIPLDVTVAAGGGASFGVAATGTPPFTYAWTTNGVLAQNGGRVSGANTNTLTIANLNASDDGLQIIAYVTNNAGFDHSDRVFGPTTLTVTNPSVGVIYSEAFPFVGQPGGNYPLSGVGWAEAVPGTPNVLFQAQSQTSSGAAFAFLGSPGTVVYYTSTASDTNQAGLPFPNVNLGSYTDLTFSVDLAPNFAGSNVTAFIAVELSGSNWFVSATPLPVPTASDSSTYATYTLAFNPAAANWKNLTVTASSGVIGATVGSNLKGVMTGAGLVFVTVGSGGDFNFDNFNISGSGLGGINVSPLLGNNLNLSWVGNPAVELQSTTNLTSLWQDMPATYGLYSLPVSPAGPQKFFRLKSP